MEESKNLIARYRAACRRINELKKEIDSGSSVGEIIILKARISVQEFEKVALRRKLKKIKKEAEMELLKENEQKIIT